MRKVQRRRKKVIFVPQDIISIKKDRQEGRRRERETRRDRDGDGERDKEADSDREGEADRERGDQHLIIKKPQRSKGEKGRWAQTTWHFAVRVGGDSKVCLVATDTRLSQSAVECLSRPRPLAQGSRSPR